MLLRKVLYASDYPCAGAPGGGLPQQHHHHPALCGDGAVPGRGLQANVSAAPHANAGGHDLLGPSHLVLLMDRPVQHPRRARVRRHAAGLDGYIPGGNAAEYPHR